MAELVAAIPLGQLGISGATIILLALIVRSIIKGDLVPRATHRAIVERIEEHNKDLRLVADRERDGHDETLRQLDTLTTASRTTIDLLKVLRDRTGVQGDAV